MKDMIEYAIKDDEDYLDEGSIKKIIPTKREILNIVSDAETDGYVQYIGDLNYDAIQKIIDQKRKLGWGEEKIDEWIEHNIEKIRPFEIEGDFRDMILSSPYPDDIKNINIRYEKLIKTLKKAETEPIIVQRKQMITNPQEFINHPHEVGIYWSEDEPISYGDPETWGKKVTNRVPVLLTAEVTINQINTVKTIVANLARPSEKEIRLKDHANVRLLEVCFLKKENWDCKKRNENIYLEVNQT